MTEIFVLLYPLVAVFSFLGYVPQIVRLVRARDAEDKIALQSWCTWMGTYTISLGYGMTHLNDAMFVFTVCVNLLAIVCVVGLVLYNRHVRFRPRMELAPAYTTAAK